MKHSSIKLNTPVEFVNVTSINPLISKCQIKVCYVGDDPNRNGTVITKETAQQLAESLPGSPIVGYYNEHSEDFEEHNKIFEISNGEMKIVETTKPYGFVDIGAKVWFQKFLDDGKVEREYLMTEGYLWTGQYPECQRVITDGNNQSMELDPETLKGHWAESDNDYFDFFIINEAIISKLCILGEEFEPCFEGANVTAPTIQFSFGDGFKTQLFSMIAELKNLLEEGGTEVEDKELLQNEEEVLDETEQTVENENEVIVEEQAEIPAEESSEQPAEEGEEAAEEVAEEESQEAEEEVVEEPAAEEEEPKPAYSLEEVVEYQELSVKYSNLESQYNQLLAEKQALEEAIEPLKTFKAASEKKEKQKMIDSFYMLSDEDKKDVIEHIDTYSLEDIEAKLSILCVRNKVNFSLEEHEEQAPTTYNLNEALDCEDSLPDWIRAVRETMQNS